jgi:hypothetical protein
MAYDLFDYTKPNTTDTRQASFDDISINLMALRDGIMMGLMPQWNLSVRNTADTSATPDYSVPQLLKYTNSNEMLYMYMTWDVNGYVTKIIYKYSTDSGATKLLIGREEIAYDVDYNVTSTTWYNTEV